MKNTIKRRALQALASVIAALVFSPFFWALTAVGSACCSR